MVARFNFGYRAAGRLDRLALGAALAIVIVMLLPARGTAAPPPASFYGVSGSETEPRDFRMMAAANVGTYRTVFGLRVAKPHQDGPYDWRTFDAVVRETALNGIEMVPIVYGVPAWLSTERGTTPLSTPTARYEFNRYTEALVARYGPSGEFWSLYPGLPFQPITTWQIWNEPNSRTWWLPRPDPRDYGTLLDRAAGRIHAIDPFARVLSAGIVAEPTNPKAIRGAGFLRRLFNRSEAARTLDAVAYHPYAPSVEGVRRQLLDARGSLRRAGAPRMPIWVTEVGWGSVGPDDHPLIKSHAGQVRTLQRTFGMLARQRKLGVRRALWYHWKDARDDLCLWCESSGLVSPDRQPKRIYRAFREAAARR